MEAESNSSRDPGSTAAPAADAYTCRMDPDVSAGAPGPCPKCGMALEPVSPPTPAVEWVCPMHPEIVRSAPGSCPICGMALEPRTVTLDAEANPELVDMTRRFWAGAGLAVPLLTVGRSDMLRGPPLQRAVARRAACGVP